MFRFAFKLAGLLPLVLLLPQQAGAVDATVSLNYSTYIGTPQTGAPGVTQWLGIRYAAPPLGNLRFARPQDPPVVSTPQPANAVSAVSSVVFASLYPDTGLCAGCPK